MSIFDGPADRLPQRAGFLLLPNFSLMAFSSAIEPLRAANVISGKPLYEWSILSVDGEAVAASNGILIVPDFGMVDRGYDFVAIVGGTGAELMQDPALLNWCRRLVRMGTDLGAISSAPYVLANAGLLDNRVCTIHWEFLDGFREDHPDLDVSNELYEIDGPIFTVSGGTASIDVMSRLIEIQHGHALAAHVSEWFLHKRIRDRSEHQRMDLRSRVGVSHPKLLAAIELMEANLELTLNREDIAQQVNLSTRQLERLFRKYLNSTPRRYYFALRMHKAQVLLRQTSMPILDIALASGFVSASHFAKCYREFFGRTPREDRMPHGTPDR